jgi:hypothetical protein
MKRSLRYHLLRYLVRRFPVFWLMGDYSNRVHATQRHACWRVRGLGRAVRQGNAWVKIHPSAEIYIRSGRPRWERDGQPVKVTHKSVYQSL